MTACRMRTIGAGRALSCVLLVALALATGCVTLGYSLAQTSLGERAPASAASAGNSLDLTHPEGRLVVDRIGDLSGRLIRLEIEAAALAKRLGIAPPKIPVATAGLQESGMDRPRGGPLLPLGGNAPMFSATARRPTGDVGMGLSWLEAETDLLQASLDHLIDVQADRDLKTMAYPNRVPVPGRMPSISSGFGIRHDPFTGRLARHMGLDIPAAYGTAVLASGGGRVLSAGYRGPYGKAIVIDHGDGMQTLYGHCSTLYVRAGEFVMPRQKIAAVGSTGRSTGPHLHFEVIRNGARVAPGQVLATVLAKDSH